MSGDSKATAMDPDDLTIWAPTPSPVRPRQRGDSFSDVFRRATDVTDPLEGLTVARANPSVVSLVADLAARLVTIEPDAIDDAVVDGMRRMAGLLKLDRAVLWQKTAPEAAVVASHFWIKHPHRQLPDPLQLASIPFVASKLEGGEVGWFRRLEDVPDPLDRQALLRNGLRSGAMVPVALTRSAQARGALAFSSMTEYEWTPAIIEQLRLAASVFGQALARRANLQALQAVEDELHKSRAAEDDVQDPPNAQLQTSRSRDRWRAEIVYPRGEAPDRFAAGAILGQSAAIRRVLEQVRHVAATSSTVLLLGETGTGKELIAAQIHDLSSRREHKMVRVSCAAIPSTLMESELFGREKGAFTGALARQIGRFELADRSTIFLDEIGDMPMDIQLKLLRVLEERQLERLGSPKAVNVDVRIITATHRDLDKRIAEDAFREDLFYRINVFPIQVPPLRDRPDDIPLLVWRFVDEFSRSFGKRIDVIPRENMAALQQYSWPGNIRELRNVVERAMIVTTGSRLTVTLPPSGSPGTGRTKMSDVETAHVRSVLESCGWRIRGSGGAAERLGLRPTTLETRMARLGLRRPMHPLGSDHRG